MNKQVLGKRLTLSEKNGSGIASRPTAKTQRTLASWLAGTGLLALFLGTGLIESSLGADLASPDAGSRRFVSAYANLIRQVEYDLTPESVIATADGGYFALALTDSPNGVGVNWAVKLSASGRPQWQREIGCATGAPGDYAFGVSAQQTSDGGYVLGGGVVGCGSYPQRALVEKLDSRGRVTWAFAYPAGTGGAGIWKIRQTTDGGYVAVGDAASTDLLTGALIFKLDSTGKVQWQRKLGPAGSTVAYFNDVQQTSDGGYVAIGEYSTIGGTFPYPVSVLVVSFDPNGTIRWQRGFNNVDQQGTPSSYEHALTGVQASDGGFLVGGNWRNSPAGPFPQEDSAGNLLLKLDANGNLQWQKSYNGGVYCYFNGFNQVCTVITTLPFSVNQAADGGYVLAGLGNLELLDSVPQVPWLAKTDTNGNLLWQYFYYDLSSAGRPLSQYFASHTPTSDGGFMAAGFTENNDNLLGELYVVKTDEAGLAGNCSQVHDATPLHFIDPGVVVLTPALPVATTVTAETALGIVARNTSAVQRAKCRGN